MPRRIYEDYAYEDMARAECIWPMPDVQAPVLEGEHTTDVAVVGAGFTGLSAALHLSQAGVQVTVVDAKAPGWGASGRNGGFCCIGGDKAGLSTIARRFGEDAANAYLSAQRAAIDLVAHLLDAHEIDADTHSDGEVQLAHRPQAMQAMEAEQQDWAARGVAARLIPKEALAEHGLNGSFHGALHVPLGFALNPGKYVAGLANAATAAGATLHGNSPVTSITRSANGYVLSTPNGRLRAQKLIMATNGYGTDGIPRWMTGRYLPLQSNILVTRPLTDSEIREQGWTSDLMAYDSRNVLHYFRMLPDRRFLFGARGNISASAIGQAQMRAKLNNDLAALFPAWGHVETPNFWSGLVSLSSDLLPYAGPVGDWPNAWAGLNYHGNGVAMATWTGARLADMVLGKTAKLPVHTRRLRRFPLARYRRSFLHAALLHYRLKDGPPAS